MSRGINKVILVGNLGSDPERRYLPSGDAVANFSLATSESWKDKSTGEPREQTEWHRIVCFGRLAEIVGEYLRKGAKVYIEGSLRTRKWQDRDGHDRYTTEIRATDMQMLDSRASRDASSASTAPATAVMPADGASNTPAAATPPARRAAAASATPVPAGDFDEDIPFARPAALDGQVFRYDGA